MAFGVIGFGTTAFGETAAADTRQHLQIYRSSTATDPTSLEFGEPAYTQTNKTLHIGNNDATIATFRDSAYNAATFSPIAGSTSIVTLGTIATGTWSATAIGATKGGTGLTGAAIGELIYGSGANTWARLSGETSTTRKFLRSVGVAGVATAPAWDTLQTGDIPDLSATYQPMDSNLTALAGVSSTGVLARTGSGTAAARTITGTANEVTVTNGNGVSGNPTLSLPQSIIDTGICEGRLTLTSATTTTPVTTTDVTGATSIYFSPLNGSRIALYDGSSTWGVYSFSELTFALGTLTSDKNYDLFVWNNGGTITLAKGTAWSSDTARVSGSAGEIVMQDGVWVNKYTEGSMTALTGRYVGTFRTTATTTTEDSAAKRFLWNATSRSQRPRALRSTDTSDRTTALNTYTQVGSVQVAYVIGLAEQAVGLQGVGCMLATGASSALLTIGSGTTTALSTANVGITSTANYYTTTTIVLEYPAIGLTTRYLLFRDDVNGNTIHCNGSVDTALTILQGTVLA